MTSDSQLRRATPMLSVLAIVAVGLVFISLSHWRIGSGLLGVAAAWAALLRIVLPDQKAALLVVRSKAFDVTFMLALAGLLFVLVLWRVG